MRAGTRATGNQECLEEDKRKMGNSGQTYMLHSRPESPEWPGMMPRECVCTSYKAAWILGICRAQGSTAHILLLRVKAVKKLDKWNARITWFGFGCCCLVHTRTVESCLTHHEWLDLQSQF